MVFALRLMPDISPGMEMTKTNTTLADRSRCFGAAKNEAMNCTVTTSDC